MKKAALALVLVLVACSSEPAEQPPPIFVGPEDGLDIATPVFADAESLYVVRTSETNESGMFRVSLADPSDRELLVPGLIYESRIEGNAIHALLPGRLLTVPLDGSASIELVVDEATVATASIGTTTYALEHHKGEAIATRIVAIANETDPERVIFEGADDLGSNDPNTLIADNGYLYWPGFVGYQRIAVDGSETEPTLLGEPEHVMNGVVIDGILEPRNYEFLLGAINHEVFALRELIAFVPDGGELSNGAPTGRGDVGAALYTVGAPDIARRLRNDVRVVNVRGNELLGQLHGGDLVSIDAASGTETRLNHTSHLLDGFEHIVRNDTAVFYEHVGGKPAQQAIYRVDIETAP